MCHVFEFESRQRATQHEEDKLCCIYIDQQAIAIHRVRVIVNIRLRVSVCASASVCAFVCAPVCACVCMCHQSR